MGDVSPFHRYTGNGVFALDPFLIAEAAGIDPRPIIRMGRKGWLLGSTSLYRLKLDILNGARDNG